MSAFKNYFDVAAAGTLADQLRAGHPSLNRAAFIRIAIQDLESLEFMGRVRQFAAAMRSCLPNDIPQALHVIEHSLPPAMPNCDMITDGYLQWPVGEFIATYCVDHPEPAMRAMYALTMRFSSEFAVRPFVQHDPEGIMAQLLAWTQDPNPHIRRWCSEGIRFRLPWGKKLRVIADEPRRLLPILEALKDDPERYVQRSVGNNLNDIASIDPELAVEIATRWMADGGEGRQWTVKHGLRTLVKKGNTQALALLGFGPAQIEVTEFSLDQPSVALGEQLILTLAVRSTSTAKQTLMIDYVVHYMKANGKTSPKVFKWTSITLESGETFTAKKKQHFRDLSTRKHHRGTHRIEIQANGSCVAEVGFELT